MRTSAILAVTVMAAVLAGGVRRAAADVVVLADGSRREGKVVREDDREVVLEVAQGRLKAELVIDRAEVVSIERGPTVNERLLAEVDARRSALKSGDAAGWLAFGEWLDRQNGFSAEARAAYEKVVAIDPDNAAARKKLGYEQVGGQWMTREEIAAAKGPAPSPSVEVSPGQSAAQTVRAAPEAGAQQRLDNIRIALADEVRKEQAATKADADARAREQWLKDMQALADERAARAQAAVEVESGGVVLGPYGYGYYGVRSSNGQYVPFVPYNGHIYYYTGTSMDTYPFVTTVERRRCVTVPSSYVRYSDGPWTFQLGGGGTGVRYEKKK